MTRTVGNGCLLYLVVGFFFLKFCEYYNAGLGTTVVVSTVVLLACANKTANAVKAGRPNKRR